MTQENATINTLLINLGYQDKFLKNIETEISILLNKINFNKIKASIIFAKDSKDNTLFISLLNELMKSLEPEGYYRPDIPRPLLMMLVNGKVINKENIYSIIDNSKLTTKEKFQEKELLSSCAAITQLGYILLSLITENIKVASSGPHVFIVAPSFSKSVIFIDFSIESIIEINLEETYELKNGFYYLKNKSNEFLSKYYSFFHLTEGCGLAHNIHNNLGIAFDKVKRHDDAILEYEESIKIDPLYIEAYNNLGVATDECEKAISYLEKAISMNPDYVEAHCNLGNIYALLEEYDKAVSELTIALKLSPENAVVHNNLGYIYTLQNKTDEAMNEFKESIRLNHSYTLAHYNLANIYEELKRYNEAIFEYQETLKLEPEYALAYKGLGNICYNIGNIDTAINSWINAVFLEPELIDEVPDKLMLKVNQKLSRLKNRT